MLTPATLKELCENSCNAFGEKVALQIRENEQYGRHTYQEMGSSVRHLSDGLLELGLKKGDRVALLAKNCPEWVMVYFAVVGCGCILVPIDSLLKIQEIKHILHDSEAKVLFAAESYMGDILDKRDTLKSLEQIVVMQPTRKWDGCLLFSDVFCDHQHPENQVGPDDMAVIIYTSGTTGKAKGVMLTHRNITSNVVGATKAIKILPTDVFLSVLPLHHTFEATGGFLSPFYCGSTITYATSLKSKEIIQDIKDTGVTILIGVPLLFEKMLNGIFDAIKKKPLLVQAFFNTSLGLVKFGKLVLRTNLGKTVFNGLRQKAGIDSLRLLVCGGAPLSPEIQTGFEELGLQFIQGYGTTEASPVITVSPVEKSKLNAVGLPLEGVEVKIAAPNETGIGEIIVKGPNVMQGYYRNKTATDEVVRNGWLHTGDCGYLDEEGYLHITGRLKNVIVTGAGKNVYPEEIEAELDKSPFIQESLVLAQCDPGRRRESVHAVIVPDYDYLETHAEQHGLTLNEAVIDGIIGREIKKCCDNLADYKRVKDFQIRDEEFEKTSTRKIKRYLYEQKSIELK